MKMMSFDKAREIYRSCLPSQELAEELHEKCRKEWEPASNSLILTGPSGNSISFECPDRYAVHFWIDGYSDCIGMRHVVYKRYAKVMRLFPGKDHYQMSDSEIYMPGLVLPVKDGRDFQTKKEHHDRWIAELLGIDVGLLTED